MKSSTWEEAVYETEEEALDSDRFRLTTISYMTEQVACPLCILASATRKLE